MKILVLHGPNLNMLGIREINHYGKETYEDLVNKVTAYCKDNNLDCEFYQSNHEGDLVDKIQQAYLKQDAIIINPGAYTHTSIAILDALKSVMIPTVEVHISKVSEREEFRQVSYVSLYAEKKIEGQGTLGYIQAVDYLKERYNK